ncbi:MAG: ESPR-type extended signal peptide-containing protein [Phascolarctobacterium sp.]|nr:ESPR-type extended signal peptide-containing protein [Phascolarctobacterium sp.]
MNHIYKIVWNKVRNCYMVVSEYAKSQTKGCTVAKLFGSKRLAKVAAAALMIGGLGLNGLASAEVQSGVYYTDSSVIKSSVSNADLIFGSELSAIGSDNATAESALIIGGGNNKIATEPAGTLVGTGNYATIINGLNNTVNQTYGTVIGSSGVNMYFAEGYATSRSVALAARNVTVSGRFDAAITANNSTVSGDYATLIGSNNSSVNGSGSVLMGGNNSTVDAAYSFGYGANASTDVNYSIVMGYNAKVSSDNEDSQGFVAIGQNAVANDDNFDASTETGNAGVTAIGLNAQATNRGATALGYETNATGYTSTAVGASASSAGFGAVAVGPGADAKAFESIAIGYQATATVPDTLLETGYLGSSIAIGTLSYAGGLTSIAMGDGASAEGISALALGSASQATGSYAIATGQNSQASGNYAIANGGWANASGVASTAVGSTSQATDKFASAFGYGSKATAEGAVAAGAGAQATDRLASAFGYTAKATAAGSTAVGYGAQATVNNGVALGDASVANTAQGVAGYDPITKAASTDESATWKSTLSAVSVGNVDNWYTRQITSVAAGTADTDAVNVAQLKQVADAVGNITNYVAGDNITFTTNEAGDTVINSQGTTYVAGDNITITTNEAGESVINANITDKDTTYTQGQGITIDENNQISANLVQGSGIELTNNEDGSITISAVNSSTPAQSSTVAAGMAGDDSFEDQHTIVIKYGDKTGTGTVADNDDTTTATIGNIALSSEVGDISSSNYVNYFGDSYNLVNAVEDTMDEALKHTTVEQGDENIIVSQGLNADGGMEYTVSLNRDIEVDSVTIGGDTVINNNGITTNVINAGNTTINDNGITTNEVKVGSVTIDENGIDAGKTKITNVAAGTEDTDAVNFGQLKELNQNVQNVDNRINKLDSRVNKVGAGAAALAALHPLDFDPDDKLTFAAGYGHYKGESAAAIGAFYRPDEKVMISVAGTVGNGEDMINAGVSFSLDRTPRVTTTKTAMARDILDLKGQVAQLTALVQQLTGNAGMARDMFPDVPENHWAYEYVKGLVEAGVLVAYPDGLFNGDRSCTRYEFAAMLYRAMQRGTVLPEKVATEFAPEIGRFRVDRIHGADDSNNKIERIRVNGDHKYGRDNYGSKNPQPVTSRGPQYPASERISK